MKILYEKRSIPYRIEMTKTDAIHPAYADETEYAYNSAQVVDFLTNIIEDNYKVDRIVRMTSDGKGYDVTAKYKKYFK